MPPPRVLPSVPPPPPPPPIQPPWRRLLAVGASGLLLGGVLLGLQFARLGADPTAPFFVGTSWHLDEELAARGVRVRLNRGNGYDGQWFLGLAYDPLLRGHLAAGFDMPRYRAGRPLQAVAGRLLAGGRQEAIPLGLLAVGPLALGLGCAATGRLLAAHGRSRWWGLGFALVPGVVVGVTFATAEPLGLALAALGLSLALDGRLLAAGLGFAGAGLTKESYLAFAAVAALWLALRPGRAARARLAGAAAVLAPGVLALGLWWAYVARMVAASPADARPVAALGPPLAGWGQALGLVAAGDYVADAPVGPLGPVLLAGSLVLAVAGIVAGLRRTSLPARAGLLLGLYGLVLSAELLGRFLSSMRALAPTVLAAGLAIVVGPGEPVSPGRPAEVTEPAPRPGGDSADEARPAGRPCPPPDPVARPCPPPRSGGPTLALARGRAGSH
jgi:hypothetical protein